MYRYSPAKSAPTHETHENHEEEIPADENVQPVPLRSAFRSKSSQPVSYHTRFVTPSPTPPSSLSSTPSLTPTSSSPSTPVTSNSSTPSTTTPVAPATPSPSTPSVASSAPSPAFTSPVRRSPRRSPAVPRTPSPSAHSPYVDVVGDGDSEPQCNESSEDFLSTTTSSPCSEATPSSVAAAQSSPALFYHNAPIFNKVVARTLMLGKGAMEMFIAKPLSYINTSTFEAKIANLAVGQSLRVGILALERLEPEIEPSPNNNTTTNNNTVTRVLEPCAHMFREIRTPSVYRLSVTDTHMLQQFMTGQYYLENRDGLIESHTAVIKSVLQTASITFARSHIRAITRALDDIFSMLGKIPYTVTEHDNDDAKLRTYAQEAQELTEFLELIASVRTSQVQRVDFDTRVGRLRVESKIVLEEAYMAIEENKAQFKKALQTKQLIDKQQLGSAANLIARMSLCVKLTILLAHLVHQKDIISGNDAAYIQLSHKHLYTAIEESHKLHSTLQMFSPPLLKKHGMFAWVKSFFYVEQPKLLHALRQWRVGMDNGDKGGNGVSVTVSYNPVNKALAVVNPV